MKKYSAPYAITSLLLLACPYAVPMLYRYFRGIAEHTFRMTPWWIFMFAAAFLLPALLVPHVYSFHRLQLPRKQLIELGLSAVFIVAAALVFFNVIFLRRILDRFPIVCCFLFVFTLLTALLFGNDQDGIA